MLREKMTKKWDSSTTTRFVEEYAKHTCLWDVNNDDYRCRMMRDLAVKEIVSNMNIDGFTVTDAKIKIRIIRNTYINEIKKIRDRKKYSKKARSTGYVCTIPWFKVADRFLRSVVRKKVYPTKMVALDNELPETISTRIITSGKNRKQRQKRSFVNGDVNRSRYVDVNSTDNDDDLRVNSPTDLLLTHAREAVGRPSSVTEVIDLTDNIDGVELDDDDGVVLDNNSNESSPSEMERNGAGSVRRRSNDANKFDVFAKHVAIQLKRLPLENALRVQNDMHQLLINERLAVIRQNKKKGLIIEHND